jgi:lysyl-tRNA synthetase class 2
MSQEHNEYRAARAAKAARLRELGHDPFGAPFAPTHAVVAARALAPELLPGQETQPRHDEVVRLAGRIGNLRKAGGKLIFATLYDRSRADAWLEQGRMGIAEREGAEAKKLRGIQLYLEKGALGEATFEIVKQLDLADWVGVTGQVGRTRTGEVSLFVSELRVLGKAMLPPPHQAGADSGELAPEIRQRRREVDLLMNDAALATFVQRSRIIAAVRSFFTGRGFLEVETPMLHTVLGGAAARPFITHHNALDLDLFLRIAPELHLKRLIVGGLERVFEINRNFRNEGLSPRHNPEFTMIEWYQAYADHHIMMDLSEALLRQVADSVLGTRILSLPGGVTIDLGQPFARVPYHEATARFAGVDFADRAAMTTAGRRFGLKPDDFPSWDRFANTVWEELVEPHLVQPTFITDQPTWLTPLCRSWPEHPERTMRFELFINRMELGNAYSELNDPDLQRQRFAEQLAEATAAKDDEAGVAGGRIDDDYCTALDHGLPVTGGQGIGIDRLVMLFTGSQTIRDVILFPTLRPE